MAHDRYVVIKLAAELTGYTAKAIQRKIQEGVWPEGVMWKKAPDGRVLIDMEGYRKWVEGELVSSRAPRPSKSASRTRESATA